MFWYCPIVNQVPVTERYAVRGGPLRPVIR